MDVVISAFLGDMEEFVEFVVSHESADELVGPINELIVEELIVLLTSECFHEKEAL